MSDSEDQVDGHEHFRGGEFFGDSNSGDEFGTPTWLVEPLLDALDQELYDLDPASGAEPRPYAETRYTEEDDGLKQSWFGHVWMNPPYGRGINERWARKAWEEANRDAVDSITALVPNNAETEWFQSHYAQADLKCEVKSAISFYNTEFTATFDSAIVVWGVDALPDDYLAALSSFGELWLAVDGHDLNSAAEVTW
ncbi:hypothetical protein Z052_01910 [Halorubrum sp. C191]|uniref:DNA N-6-adenine-methyltransferase n=1 Tax=Halorubrum sp. C191 TaxID=1383842 RepID=UPI000C06CA17|nr:DNA N-6-adenine-methyltransferase [Halorubrum sp. C191]PHQ43918.1 hypothetical protein Z052_01910 [Halorubrum sp. C191]